MLTARSGKRIVRFMVCLVSAAVLTLLLTVDCANAVDSGELISVRAKEVAARMHEQGALDCESAIGGYVFRLFNHVSDDRTKEDLANFRKSLEGANAIRIKNERALGREPDVAALTAEVEASVAKQAEKKPGDGVQTHAVKYTQKGERYRIEQFQLPNEVPLDRLHEQLKSGEISFKPTYTRTWNGKQYAEILDPNAGATGATEGEVVKRGFAALSFDNQAAGLLKFTKYSRNGAMDPQFLEKLTSQLGTSAIIEEAKTQNGDEVLILKVGSAESVAAYLEATILPAKGYCIQSAYTKMRGAIMSRDEYSDFVLTSAGFWLPTRVRVENYRFDEKEIPYLFMKEELIAFETPTTNVPLEDSIFDLGSTAEFKALPQLKHLLPKGDPYIKPRGMPVNRFSSSGMYLLLLNGVVVGGAIVFWCFRRKSSRRKV